MSYKWKPSKAQRKAFATRMQDPSEKAAYEARKEAKAEKRRAGSRFDYASAGGEYIPTHEQFKAAFNMDRSKLSPDQIEALNMVQSGYIMKEKVHHDYIHIVNELIRKGN